MFTINVNANVHVTVTDESAREQLARMEAKIDGLTQTGAALMSANAQVTEFLGKLDTYTSQLAADQTAQTAAIENIRADIARLKTEPSLSPEVVARLTAAEEGLAAAVAFETAQAATLTALAAETEDPLPPPVEP